MSLFFLQRTREPVEDIRAWTRVQYPFLSEFGDMQENCRLHLARFPNDSPPLLGPSYFQYSDAEFEDQDQWNNMMLCNQLSRYLVQVAPGQWYEVDGLGLPFERLHFKAQEQLIHTTNAFVHLTSLTSSARTSRRWLGLLGC